MFLLNCVHKISVYTLLQTYLCVLKLKHSNHVFPPHCEKCGSGIWKIADVQAGTWMKKICFWSILCFPHGWMGRRMGLLVILLFGFVICLNNIGLLMPWCIGYMYLFTRAGRVRVQAVMWPRHCIIVYLFLMQNISKDISLSVSQEPWA